MHEAPTIVGFGKGLIYKVLPLYAEKLFQACDIQVTVEQPYCCTKAYLYMNYNRKKNMKKT